MPVVDAGHDAGVPWLALEWVEGTQLEALFGLGAQDAVAVQVHGLLFKDVEEERRPFLRRGGDMPLTADDAAWPNTRRFPRFCNYRPCRY